MKKTIKNKHRYLDGYIQNIIHPKYTSSNKVGHFLYQKCPENERYLNEDEVDECYDYEQTIYQEMCEEYEKDNPNKEKRECVVNISIFIALLEGELEPEHKHLICDFETDKDPMIKIGDTLTFDNRSSTGTVINVTKGFDVSGTLLIKDIDIDIDTSYDIYNKIEEEKRMTQIKNSQKKQPKIHLDDW